MTALMPKVFVGSSSEARELAGQFCETLSSVSAPMPWWKAPDFRPGLATLEALVDATAAYDFGLFILTPDDTVESKGERRQSARDNVLFEFGLFLGELGRDRAFAVIQESDKRSVKVPSDLLGITLPSFDVASLAGAASEIGRQIKKLGPRTKTMPLISSGKYTKRSGIFQVTISKTKLERYRSRISQKRLILVIRLKDSSVDWDQDKDASASQPRLVSDRTQPSLVLKAKGKQKLRSATRGSVAEGYLLLAAKDITLTGMRTPATLLDRGAVLIDRKGTQIR